MTRFIRSSMPAVLAGVVAAFALVSTASAHEGAGGNVGVGFGVGAPTALSVEVAPTPHSGLEFALGIRAFDTDDLYMHLVFKQNFLHLAYGPTVVVPVYLGGGGFLRQHNPDGPMDLGVRFPLGVNFDFTRTPVQIFAEGALEVTLASDVHPDHPVGLGGFAGARVWF
jgi:hypothetical protein